MDIVRAWTSGDFVYLLPWFYHTLSRCHQSRQAFWGSELHETGWPVILSNIHYYFQNYQAFYQPIFLEEFLLRIDRTLHDNPLGFPISFCNACMRSTRRCNLVTQLLRNLTYRPQMILFILSPSLPVMSRGHLKRSRKYFQLNVQKFLPNNAIEDRHYISRSVYKVRLLSPSPMLSTAECCYVLTFPMGITLLWWFVFENLAFLFLGSLSEPPITTENVEKHISLSVWLVGCL